MSEPDQSVIFEKMGQSLMAMPYAKALSMTMEAMADGEATITMPYAEALIGDPDTGVVHGGAVSALLDTCAGGAVLSHPDVTAGVATLNLRIDYMRPATPGQAITAVATCYHVTRSVAFIRATATDDDKDRPVATAAGAFTLQQSRGTS